MEWYHLDILFSLGIGLVTLILWLALEDRQ